MKIPIIQGNEKILFWIEVTKPRTESCAQKNCNNCERGAVCNIYGSSRKSAVWISKLSVETIKGH